MCFFIVVIVVVGRVVEGGDTVVLVGFSGG